jgi:hypothetical protein
MIAKLIAQTDCFHFLPFSDPNSAWYKEWHHFCIMGNGVEAIINLNLSGDTRLATKTSSHLARMVLLVREQSWDGDVDTIPPRDALAYAGLIDLQFGHNTIHFQDGIFYLSVALRDRPISIKLNLRAVTYPMLMRSNAPIGEGTINWVVVPKLIANGTIANGPEVYTLRNVPAYHDHNWGHWLWGHDFAWEWGFALPEQVDSPWSLVFDRTTNRARSHTLELTLALWKGETLHRVFTQYEITTNPIGYFGPRRISKFPRVMALVAPELTTDIPQALEITAAAGGDSLRAFFTAYDVAQVVIPNETDLGVTIINEVSGRLTLRGEIKGEPVNIEGRAIFEFLTW